MELKFLGRGSAFNVKEGNTSAFIKEENRLVLIDCGSNIFDRIIKSNILDGVEQLLILITHTHPDHIGSIGDLILYCHHIKNIIPAIYINRFAGHDFDKYMEYQNIDSKMYNIINETNSLFNMISSIFKIYDFENIYTDHVLKRAEYAVFEQRSFSSAFKFKYNNKTILYTGDTNKLPDGYENADEIYVECTSLECVNNPHFYISKLYLVCHSFLNKIYCMHFNSDEAISKAKELGFNVVELYEYKELPLRFKNTKKYQELTTRAGKELVCDRALRELSKDIALNSSQFAKLHSNELRVMKIRQEMDKKKLGVSECDKKINQVITDQIPNQLTDISEKLDKLISAFKIR